MAQRADSVTKVWGIAAAVVTVAAVLLAAVGIATRLDWSSRLAPGDLAAVRFTLWQAFWSAVISVACAVPVARALARREFRGRAALVTLLGAPFILPVIVAVLGLVAVFGRNGWLNTLLAALGLPGLSIYGFHGVVLAHVFFNLPLATRLLLQAWQAIPAERFRLVAQLQLTPWAVFRTLELPVLRQVLPGIAALIFVICMTSFAVALTLGGGPKATTVELAIYQAFKFDFDLGRAAILSLIQLILAGGTAVIALRFIPDVGFGAGRDLLVKRWDARRPAQRLLDGLAIGLTSAFLLLPLSAILLRGVWGIAQLPQSVWSAAGNSLFVACLSVFVLLVLALPLAGWIAGQKTNQTEAIGLLGLAASPLMIGTGWFILINPVIDPRLLALPVTAFVNALMALPFVLRILVPQIRETLMSYGKLAQSLRLRGWSLWRWVILPRLGPQLGFAAGLTGALSLGDLGVIALFADPDRVTLPLQMYRLMSAYQMQAAAGAALLLVALSVGVFWLCDKGGRWRAET